MGTHRDLFNFRGTVRRFVACSFGFLGFLGYLSVLSSLLCLCNYMLQLIHAWLDVLFHALFKLVQTYLSLILLRKECNLFNIDFG